MFDINEVHAKSDLIGYVERAGGKLEKTGNRYACACPLHGGKNETAFSLYFDKGVWKWKCFTDACGGGDAIAFVERWMYGKEPDVKKRFKLACEWIIGKNIDDAPAMYKSAEERLEEARIEEIAARERKEARLRELQVAEKHLYYHNNRKQWAIEEWAKNGLDEWAQEFFYLGSDDDFTYKVKNEFFHSPTLTIPYFGEQRELLQIQHRLLMPKNPNDKYRPEKKWIDMPNFLAIPEMGYDGGMIIVMEGGKKSMVCWTRLHETDVQVIGVPSLSTFHRLTEILRGKKPIIIRDPTGSTTDENQILQPYNLAKATGGRLLDPPAKIDDYLIDTNVSANDFYKLLKQSRKIA